MIDDNCATTMTERSARPCQELLRRHDDAESEGAASPPPPPPPPSSPSLRRRHRSERGSSLPPPVVHPRTRASLVRLPCGRRAWRMDCSSSRRTEAMLRLRMDYLEEEMETKAHAAAGGNGARRDSTPPERRRRERSDATSGGGGADVPNEISLEGDRSAIARPKSPQPHREDDQEFTIPVVQLPRNDATSVKNSRTYLDFGEDNHVGKTARRSLLVVAPSGDDSNGGRGDAFHIRLDRCIFDNGIACSVAGAVRDRSPKLREHAKDGIVDNENDADVGSDANSSYVDNSLDPAIRFSLKGGESKMIDVAWNPNEEGCVREVVNLRVTTATLDEERCWQFSIVILGEANFSADDDDGDCGESSTIQDLIGGSNKFTGEEGDAKLEITESVECSSRGRRDEGEGTKENDSVGARPRGAAGRGSSPPADGAAGEEEPDAAPTEEERAGAEGGELWDLELSRIDGTPRRDAGGDAADGDAPSPRAGEGVGAGPAPADPSSPLGRVGAEPARADPSPPLSGGSSGSSSMESGEITGLDEITKMLGRLHEFATSPLEEEGPRHRREGGAGIAGRTERNDGTAPGRPPQSTDEGAATPYDHKKTAKSNVKTKDKAAEVASLLEEMEKEHFFEVEERERKLDADDLRRRQTQNSAMKDEAAEVALRSDETEEEHFLEEEERARELDTDDLRIRQTQNNAIKDDAAEVALRSEAMEKEYSLEEEERARESAEVASLLEAMKKEYVLEEERSMELDTDDRRKRHTQYNATKEEAAEVALLLEEMEKEHFLEESERARESDTDDRRRRHTQNNAMKEDAAQVASLSEATGKEHFLEEEERATELDTSDRRKRHTQTNAMKEEATDVALQLEEMEKEHFLAEEERARELDNIDRRRRHTQNATKEEAAEVALLLEEMEKEHFLEEEERARELDTDDRRRRRRYAQNDNAAKEEAASAVAERKPIELLGAAAVTSTVEELRPEEVEPSLRLETNEKNKFLAEEEQRAWGVEEGDTMEGRMRWSETSAVTTAEQEQPQSADEASRISRTGPNVVKRHVQYSPASALRREEMESEQFLAEEERSKTAEMAEAIAQQNNELEKLFASVGLVATAADEDLIMDGLSYDDDNGQAIFDQARLNDEELATASLGSLSSEDSMDDEYGYSRRHSVVGSNRSLPITTPPGGVDDFLECFAELQDSYLVGNNGDVKFSPDDKGSTRKNILSYYPSDTNADENGESILTKFIERGAAYEKEVDGDSPEKSFDDPEQYDDTEHDRSRENEEFILTKMTEQAASSEDVERYSSDKSFDSKHEDDLEDENEEYILNKLMEQANNDMYRDSPDKRFDSEIYDDLEHDMSDLNTFIDSVSKIEEATQFQHEYITSTTNKDDLHTQLVNINNQIDQIPYGITSPSNVKTKQGYHLSSSNSRRSNDQFDSMETTSPERKKKDNSAKNNELPAVTTAESKEAQLLLTTPNNAAQNNYFYQQQENPQQQQPRNIISSNSPNRNHRSPTAEKERDVERRKNKKYVDKETTNNTRLSSQQSARNDGNATPPILLSSTIRNDELTEPMLLENSSFQSSLQPICNQSSTVRSAQLGVLVENACNSFEDSKKPVKDVQGSDSWKRAQSTEHPHHKNTLLEQTITSSVRSDQLWGLTENSGDGVDPGDPIKSKDIVVVNDLWKELQSSKQPHQGKKKRSEQTVTFSVRSDQLGALAETSGSGVPKPAGNVSAGIDSSNEPQSTEHHRRPMFSMGSTVTTKISKEKETTNGMNQPRVTTKASARKCYFFKSPRSRRKIANRIRRLSSCNTSNDRITNTDSGSKPQSSHDIPHSSKEQAKESHNAKKDKVIFPAKKLHSREMTAYEKHMSSMRGQKKSKECHSPNRDDTKKTRDDNGPSLSPREKKAIEFPAKKLHSREMTAYEKHMSSTRGQKKSKECHSPNRDDRDDNGPSLNPREKKAIEKHIHSTRRRDKTSQQQQQS